jgi:hypothetical protein
MFKKASSPRAKGKERAGSVDEKSGLTKKLRQRTPAEKEARKNGPYVADFDRKQTFDLDIDPKVKRPFNSALFGVIVKKGFSKLYNNSELSDVTLVLGDEKVPAHKTVLSVWSDTFRAMLDTTSAWKESTQEELVVDVEADGYECFKFMLQYMYTGDSSFINDHNVFPLISLTNYYGIHPLKELCGQLLSAIVDGDNLFHLLDLSEHFDVKSLRTACCEHLAANFGDLLDGDKLSELKPNAWVEMLMADDLQIRSEQQVFEAVLRYADQHTEDKAARDHILNTILPCVRFPFLPAEYLIDEVEAEESIKHLPIVRELLFEALKFKVYPKSISADCPRLQPRCGFRFDPSNCATQLTLSMENTKVVVTTAGGWMNVRTREQFVKKQNYIEFKITGSGNYMIGVISGTISTNCYAGQFANGWTYYSPGQLYHNNSTPHTGQSYTMGDRIGIAVDFENSKFLFYKNDQLSITVSDIPTTELYPVVCMSSAGESVEILPNSMQPGTEKKKSKK